MSLDELHSIVQLHYYAGRVIVAISGNFGTQTGTCPNVWPEVITVGATTNEDEWYSGSNWFSGLDFVAPGWGMYTALWESACTGTAGFIPQYGNGTSAAAPVVSGIASLLFARADKLGITLTPDMVYECLKESAEAVTSPTPAASYQGWGRVNALGALMALEELYYDCKADLTHTNDPGDWGYSVPDGVVDQADLDYFTYWHGQGNLAIADVASCSNCETLSCGNPNGIVNLDDYVMFLCWWNEGCP